MAEARNAIDLYYLQKRGFQITGVEDGYYTVSVSVPYPSTVLQATSVQIRGAWKYLKHRIWPASPRTVLAVMVGVTGLTVKARSDSWVRSGWLADMLWRVDAKVNAINPFQKYLAVELRVGYLAATAAFIGMLGIVALERLALRCLLTYHGWLYLKPRQKPPLSVKLWGGLVSLFSGSIDLTYGFALSLPSLPLPPLKQTASRYLESVQPLMTEEQFAQTKLSAESFVKTEGKKLQRYLFLKWLVSQNYVANWWETYVYLRGRTPLAVNSNYYIMDSQFRPTNNPLERASGVIHHMLNFKDLIEKEALKPLMIRGMVPLCMEQYERMFGTCRVPGREGDLLKHNISRHIVVLYKGQFFELNVYHGARGTNLVPYTSAEIREQLDMLTNFVDMQQLDGDSAAAKNEELPAIWEKKVTTNSSGDLADEKYTKSKIKSYSDLMVLNSKQNFDQVDAKNKTESEPKYLGCGVAALTTMPRSNWAEIREMYFSDGANRASLLSIEKAAFLLVLDTKSYTTVNERARSLFHGDGFNRYFDKSITVVIHKDGYCGLNAEHTWADAPAAAHLWEYTLLHELIDMTNAAEAQKQEQKKPSPVRVARSDSSSSAEPKVSKPRRLVWDIDEDLRRSVVQAGELAQNLIADVDLEVLPFDTFGANFMKKSGISPDAFVQMALQLTYYRNRKRFDLTYESSMTRLFRKGRTETIRSLSKESVAWVLAMEKNKKVYAASKPGLDTISEDSPSSATDPKTKEIRDDLAEKLKTAAEVHNLRSKDAMSGKGIDRHLFSLYVTSKGFEIDSEFLKNALSIPWRLSTSQQTQDQTTLRDKLHPEIAKKFLSPGGGFGPVADDGYGVSYMFVADMVFFHVSSKKSAPETSSKVFTSLLKESLCDMQRLLSS